jgi:hypothetical protein
MRKRGFPRKRSFAVAAIVLVMSMAAPELAAPAGAVVARSANRIEQARPAARHALATKRRKRKAVRPLTAAQRKARLRTYLKAHPGVVAAKLGKKPAAKKPAAKKPAKKHKKPVKAHKKKPVKRAPAKKKKKRTAAAIAAAAAAAKRKKEQEKHALGTTGWAELLLLALLPFGAVGGVLLGTDRARRPREPRAPSPSKRRRTLVITPLRGR